MFDLLQDTTPHSSSSLSKALRQRGALLALLLMVGLQSAACDINEPFDLDFDVEPAIHDNTPRLNGPGAPEAPVALGAELELEVINLDSALTANEITFSAPEIFELMSVDRERLRLKAAQQGDTTLTINSASGTTLSIDLQVRTIAETTVHVLPWDEIIALDESLFEDGVAMLPNEPVTVFAEHTDQEGRIMTGFGARQWALASGEGARLTQENDSDLATLRSGEAGEVLNLEHGDSALALEVVTEADIARVALHTALVEEVRLFDTGELVELASNSDHFLHVTAYLADGRYVVGSGAQPIAPTLAPEAEGLMRISFSPQDLDNTSDDARIFSNGRAFGIQTLSNVGTTTLQVEWLGQTHDFEVRSF